MELFLNFLASGLVIGSIYGLIAIGFAVIFKTTGVLNFAQGEVMMLVAYVSWSLATELDLPLVLLIPLVVVAAAAIGALLERIFIRPMLGEPVFAIIMVTIGLAVTLRSVIVLIWGADAAAFDVPLKGGLIEIGPVVLFTEQLFAIVLFLVVALAIFLFFRFTRIGTAMRATAQDETTALLMGVDVKRISMLAWAIAAVVSGLAGIAFAMMISRAPDMWFLGLRAFPATILGGLDAPLGSGLGGLLIGVIGDLSEGYIGQGLKEISGFVVIIVILMVRPYGLFGQRELERV
ncbi:amino acid/amide ABC transporter membrane protein 1, HAAT family [Tistlia consotensis]|uniref:Amino acid/amide ABC transporter membrane protein 1, HAAT family n=1 Tax=Tistlia consotensis USBA 355 TaxID=560819 RepID=A0A1Y6BCL7_9PROT|nr:branched-chain amino acid ABC transporter permease [Tistlia consotensis]SMF04496.1 amino acid/amide ABC transporter membrane protein 1, HAAT family [Tistlia consotensis USBA 355]SNR54523.1 amino acid/amide ABC transporter membrane protein 1, HAAT family [Tistlia consotensis]